MPKLILFSGLGGDGRFFSKLPALLRARLPGVELVTPAYPEPQPGEMMPAFAARLAELHDLDGESLVGGASFGGMLAQEIAAAGRARAVFLIGTANHPNNIRILPRLLEWCCRPLPDAVIHAGRGTVRVQLWIEPGLSRADREQFVAMARDCLPGQLRRGAQMIFRWKGRTSDELTCPWFRVHGRRDSMIRCPHADERTTILKDAGHLLPMGHTEATADWLAESLREAGV